MERETSGNNFSSVVTDQQRESLDSGGFNTNVVNGITNIHLLKSLFLLPLLHKVKRRANNGRNKQNCDKRKRISE